MSDPVRPHRRQPTGLPRPWDSPGKNTGVGCHFLLQRMKVKSESEVAQSCLTLRDPMDCGLPGSSIHGTPLFPDQGSNPGPLHWEDRVLAAGPLRKSLPSFVFLQGNNSSQPVHFLKRLQEARRCSTCSYLLWCAPLSPSLCTKLAYQGEERHKTLDCGQALQHTAGSWASQWKYLCPVLHPWNHTVSSQSPPLLFSRAI